MIDIGLEAEKFLFVFFRVLSMLWLLPIFQSRTVATGYKAGLSLLVAFLLYQPVVVPDLQGDPFLILLGVMKEVFIGLSIGFFVRLLFGMVSSAGEFISMQSGLSFARVMDPTMAASVTVLEQFKSLLATMIFLGIDGHHTILRAVSTSLTAVPPGSIMIRPALFQFMTETTGKVFAASIKICAPVVVTLFLVDIALGILARLIPQVNVFIEGSSIKILITIAVLALSLNLIVPVISGLFRGMDTEILKILKAVV